MPLTITLFGPMRAQVNGQPLPPLHNRKTLWLLALLVLRHGRPVERKWLAEMLWPEAEQDQALGNLRPVLSALRRALGSESERLQSPNRHTVSLDLVGADVDLLAFDRAVASGTLPALTQAVALHTGSLLEGCPEEWAGQERIVREEDFLRALQSLADAARAAQDWAAEAGYYRQAVALDPWREAARRGLMEALAHSGDTNAAMQEYRKFCDLLRSDPRAVPAEETTALYGRLRAAARHQAVAPATAAADLSAADTSAVSAVTGYLPHPLTDLVGREKERLEIAARMRRSRLITLTGPGGIGKTRLAVEIANDSVGGYTDGVWFVALEALSAGEQVAGQIANILEVKEEPGYPLLESLTNFLRSKRLLLVLDNCEHVLRGSTQITGHLLRECAGLRVLATSREALGITGEIAWAVPALSVPDPDHLPLESVDLVHVLMEYDSVRLFVERAQATQQTFALNGDNALPVASMCARLDGLPLAIELAAARVRAMTVPQIAARLDNYLSLLTGGSRSAPSRQQTLRATLDWSYSLLSDVERLLLMRLSVFAGGFSLDAAKGICEGAGVACEGEGVEAAQVVDLLTGLVDKSLIAFKEEESGGRYRLLETVRQYASERLAVISETERIRTRHRDYFLALAEAAEPHLTKPSQGTWLVRLETENENLRTALVWCQVEPEGAQAGLRLAGALWEFWALRGQYSEGQAFLAEALARPGADVRSRERAKALNAAGVLATYQGDKEAIQALHTEALAIYQEVGDCEGAAWSLYDLGNVAAERTAPRAAQTLYEESLALFRGIGHKRGIAATLHQVGSLVSKQGDKKTARTLYTESLAISRELGNRQGVAWSLNDLGGLTWEQGDYPMARELHEESLAVFRELGHKRGIGWALHHLGKLARQQGDDAATRALYEEALAISRELADRRTIAWLLNDLGNVAVQQGDKETARTFYTESLAISRGLADRQGVAWTLHHLAGLAREQGDYATARDLHEESLAIFRERGDLQAVAWSLNDLGRLFEAQGDLAAAQARHAESLSIFQGLGNKQGVAWTLRRQSRLAFDQGDLAAARALYAESLSLLMGMGDRRGAALCLRELGAELLARGSPSVAVRIWGAAEALSESLSASQTPQERNKHDRDLARARASLGEDAFAASWAAGHVLTWDQATDSALQDDG